MQADARTAIGNYIGSYAAAFGLGWNALNITIMVSLLLRARQRPAMA
jgi:hypothetical protein